MTARDSRTPLYGIAVAAQLVDLPDETAGRREALEAEAPERERSARD